MRYLLIALFFTQNPQGIEVKKIDEFFDRDKCEVTERALNLKALEDGIRKLHVCMPDTPTK